MKVVLCYLSKCLICSTLYIFILHQYLLVVRGVSPRMSFPSNYSRQFCFFNCLFFSASTFSRTMPGYELASADRSKINKKHLCPKCEGLLREAVQTIACGHRYCKTCVETILR